MREYPQLRRWVYVQAGLWLCAMLCSKPERATAQACVSPPSGLVGWWAGEGNAADLQGTNNGAVQNGVAFASGKVGQAFSFDGVDDYVLVPDSPGLNFGTNAPMTVELWAYRTGTAPVMHLIGKRLGCAAGNINYQLALDNTSGSGLGFGGSVGGVATG